MSVDLFNIFPTKEADTPASIVYVDDAAELPVVGMKVSINPVQSGTGTPSTSNVRPITGWNDVNVWDDPVMAENIVWTQLAALDASKWDTVRSVVSFSGTKTTITPSTSSSIKQAGFDLENGHYYLVSGKYKTADSNRLLTLGFYYGNMGSNTYDERKQIEYVEGGPDVSFSMAFHCQRDNQQFRLALTSAATPSEYATVENLQVYDLTAIFPESQDRVGEIYDDEIATEGAGLANFRQTFPKDFYQYDLGTLTCVSAVNGDPYRHYAIDLETVAGTVYGANYDVVNGDLKVTKKYVDLSSLSWDTVATGSTKKALSTSLTDSYRSSDTGIIASHYVYKGFSSSASLSNPDSFDVGLYAYDGVNGYAASLYLVIPVSESPAGSLVYKLFTPTTYQIDPQRIIPLSGANQIWIDAGNIDAFEYYAEPQADLIPSVYIDGESLRDGGWYVKWRKLAAPQPKLDLTSIYGRDGSIDQTEALGDVFYEDRTVNLDMVYIGNDWNNAYSKLMNVVHGQSCDVQFADDPYWYWSARLVATEFSHKEHSLSMNGVAFPYKLSVVENVYSATVSGATEQTATELQLASSRMRVSPKVVVTGSITLKWGDNTKTLSAGTYYVRGLKVGADGVTIKVWGTGTVTITYREGSL